MIQYPEYRDCFKSYVLLGDPRIGASTITSVTANAPYLEETHLASPLPNPFNPSTRLRFYLKTGGQVSINIFDVHGRLVRRVLRSGIARAGWGEVRWNGMTESGVSAASGIYFARLVVSGQSQYVQKLVLLR